MAKKEEEKTKGGRPNKWTPEMNDKIIEFFDREATKVHDNKILANKFPTFERFAFSVGVHVDTLHEWAKAENAHIYPGFSESYMKAKALQKDILVVNGLAGLYNANFSIFVAKNATDMKDVSRTEVTGAEGTPLTVDTLSSERVASIRKKYEDELKQTLINNQ